MRYIACFSRIALSIILVGLQVLPIPVIAEAQQTTTFSGQATVVRATVLGFKPVLLSDTGPLPSSGGLNRLPCSPPACPTCSLLTCCTPPRWAKETAAARKHLW